MISSKNAGPNSSITKIPTDERTIHQREPAAAFRNSFFFVHYFFSCIEKPKRAPSSAPEDPCDGACQKGRLSPGLIGGSHLARHLTAVERGCAALLTGHVTAGGGRQERFFFFCFFFPVGLMALRRRLLTDRAALTSLGFVSRARLLLMQKTQLCKKKKKEEFISIFYFVYSILHPLACMLGPRPG